MAESNLCCGARKRTGAFFAAGSALAMSLGLILLISVLLITGYRETKNPVQARGIGNMYAASLVMLACWSILTFVLLGGIRIENKRALLVWLVFSGLLPLLLVCDLAYLLGTGQTGSTEIVYLVVLGLCVVLVGYIAAVIYYYYIEVKLRDKNPDLRAAEYTSRKMHEPSVGMAYELRGPPNLGAAASESSVFRSQRQGMDGTPSVADRYRQSLDIDLASATADGRKSPRPGSRATSRDNLATAEREGAASAYYRYQYSADKPYEKRRSVGSQVSLAQGSKQVQPASVGDPSDSTV